VLVQAFAGTGKTTTLLNVAKQSPDKLVLYLTFNKSLVESAKQLSGLENLTICTMHSLALSYIDPSQEMEIGKLSLKVIENMLCIERKDANIVLKIIDNFCASSSKQISLCHTSSMNLNNEEMYISLAQEAWVHILQKKCKMPHDVYLKLYQLSNSKLNFDIIMLDEAQDATECMLTILKRQTHSVRYLVGDIHQQIYGFRNVSNPFIGTEHTEFIKRFTLSQSFRYGYQIAHLANIFLKEFKSEKKKIYSTNLHTNILTSIRHIQTQQYTLISRTNISLLKEAFELPEGVKCYMLGKTINFEKEIMYADSLHGIENENFIGVHPKVSQFGSLDELKIHYTTLSNYKWLNRLALYREYGIDALNNFYRSLAGKIDTIENANVILSTVHQCKGLEFDNVKLSNDFIPLVSTLNTVYVYQSKSALEGYNLLYVAMTRAKKNLIINKEMYSYLQLKKGTRFLKHRTKDKCNVCNDCITQVKKEEGIHCIGFNSKTLYTYERTCLCPRNQ
jgi:superfamily I DNA/RNA helicase